MMLKKLIPAAALLALAGAAQAQVTVYGLVDAGVIKDERPDSTGAVRKTTLDFNGNSTSRIGFKGALDVAPGIKANFQLEGGFNGDGTLKTTGTGANKETLLFGRQAWAGVSGAFGEVRVGKQDSVPFQTMIGFDFNGAANIASAAGAAGIATLPGSGDRSVQYIAPTVLPGLKAQFGYQSLAPNATAGKATTSFGLTYTAGPLAVAAAGESKASDVVVATDATANQNKSVVAASYDLGVAKVGVTYSGTKNAKGAMYSVVAPVAGFNVGLQYAKKEDAKNTGTEVFVNKEIFKNTYAYADYLQSKDSTAKKFDAYAVGVIFTF